MQFLWLLQLLGSGKSSWMLELAGPASPSGSARNLTGIGVWQSRTKRGGERERDEKNSACAAYRGCPQQVVL